MTAETIIYFHGVSNDRDGRSHEPEYRALHQGIRRHNPAFPETFLGIEWGWNSTGEARPTGHELLTAAQAQLGRRAIDAVEHARDFTLNPARLITSQLRPLLMFGFADVFYYVSNAGKNDVRRAVARQIMDHLNPGADARISLTLLGHSAGAVVAFDLLFHLFYDPPVRRDRPPAGASTADASDQSGAHTFIRPEDTARPVDAAATIAALRRLRDLARAGRLRIRRLITFGSPISLLAYRSNALLAILARGDRVDAALHGLTRSPDGFGAPLGNPRWINLWDKDDLIAWPAEPMMSDAGTVVRDEYIDVADGLGRTHDAYWTSARVHQRIAEQW
jgi:hypothetical protein